MQSKHENKSSFSKLQGICFDIRLPKQEYKHPTAPQIGYSIPLVISHEAGMLM